MVEKKGTLQNLGKYDVFIEDTSENSIYFNVNLPDHIPGGKTAFSLDPPPYLLKVSSYVKVEILDYYGHPLYVEYPKESSVPAYMHGYTEPNSTARLISVHVYPSTPYGHGEIIVIGEALKRIMDEAAYNDLLDQIKSLSAQIDALYQDAKGNPTRKIAEEIASLQKELDSLTAQLAASNTPVPEEWRGVYNVRWRRRILIDKNEINDSKVIFYNAPYVTVTEIEKSYLNQVYTEGKVVTVDNSSYKVSYEKSPTYAIVTAYGFEFTSEMIGGVLYVQSPVLPQSYYEYGEYGEYFTVIDSIINSTHANVRDIYQATVVYEESQDMSISMQELLAPTSFGESEFTLTYNAAPTYTESPNLKSFAKFEIIKMDTFSGDVYRVKVLQSSEGTMTGYQVVAEKTLEDTELLFNYDAVDPSSEYMGVFADQEIFDLYWATSSWDFGTFQETNEYIPIITFSSSTLLNSMVISSSTDLVNFGRIAHFVFPTTQSYFQDGDQLELSFKLASNTAEGQFDVYASGSAFYQNPKQLEADWNKGRNDESLMAKSFLYDADANDAVAKFGKLLTSYSPGSVGQFKTAKTIYGTITIPIETDYAGSGSVLFAVCAGEWVISDVSFAFKKETNFSPSATVFTIPLNPEQEGDALSFGIKYYNRFGMETIVPQLLPSPNAPPNMTLATWLGNQNYGFGGGGGGGNSGGITPWQVVTGPNTYIDGTRNVMSGSLWIGSQVGHYAYGDIVASGGMELSVDAAPGPSGSVAPGALFRSMTYEGWYRSNKGWGDPGFMIWSGSVLYGSGDNYSGVGLELWSPGKGLRFRTDTGVLEITGSIFATDGHFINNFSVGTGSGAQRIEISASFTTGSISELAVIKSAGWGQPTDSGWAILGDGRAYFSNVSISGSVTASIADLGGWIVKSTSINSPGDYIILNSSPPYIAMGTTPPSSATSGDGVFLSGSGDFLFGNSKGQRLQYTDATGLILSSSKFFLGESGSGAYLSGSDGNLEISSSNFFIDRDGNVTMEGNITATTGRIGGWHIDSTFLSASNLVLDSGGNIRTADFLSQKRGWRITSVGRAEFEDAIIRGTLSTTVFEKNIIAAVGGQVMIANATSLSGSHTAAATTFYVDNAYGFIPNEICLLKVTSSLGFNTEFIKITAIYSGSNQHSMSVSRGFGGTTAIAYAPHEVVVSQGVSGSGFIHLNAAPSKSLYGDIGPFIDINVRTGSNQYNEVETKVRLGNLIGLYPSKIAVANPGYGLFTENGFFTGMVSSSTGNIGGWKINATSIASDTIQLNSSAGGSIKIGYPMPTSVTSGNGIVLTGAGEALIGNSSAGRLQYIDDKIFISASDFFLGSLGAQYISGSGGNLVISSSVFSLSGSTLIMTGSMSATAGYIGGWEILPKSLRSTDGTVSMSSDNSYIAFGNPPPTSSNSGEGAYIDGYGSVMFGKAVGERFYYNPSYGTFIISSSEFLIGTSGSGAYISGSHGNLEISSSNFFLSASVIRTSASIWSEDGNLGGWKLNSTMLSSPGGYVTMSSAGYIAMGNPPPISVRSGDGIFLSGSGEFLFGSSTGSRVQYTDSTGLIISSSKFFLGQSGSGAYISGSAGNMEISSSHFFLDRNGNVTMDGTITATTGAIGGWQVNSTSLTSPGSHVTMSSAGYIAMGNPPPISVTSGNGIFLNSDGTYLLGSSTGSRIQQTSTGLILSASTFTLGSSGSATDGTNAGSYVRGYDNEIEISSSGFFLDTSGNVTMQGTVTATAGRIGGWYIGATFLSASNLYLDSGGSIRTADYLSGLKGWRIRSDGRAEFQDAIIRGTLATTVFEKDVIAAVGGQLIVANATALSGSHSPTATTFYVDNAWGFVADEICVLKTTGSLGFSTEYVKVTGVYSGSNQHSMSVSRSFDNSPAVGYSSSQVIVSQGVSGSGFVYINAAPSKSLYSEYAPYIDVIQRTGSNQFNEVEVKVRLGNLSGLYPSKIATPSPGYGLFTENGYFTGMVSASSGNIGGWTINSASLDSPGNRIKLDSTHAYIALGNPPPTSSLSGTGAYIDGNGNILLGKSTGGRLTYRPDTGKLIISSSEFIMGRSGSGGAYVSGALGNLEISSSGFYLSRAGSVTMQGTITATAGAIGGWEILEHSLRSENDTVSMSADNSYIAFGNPPPTSSLSGTGAYIGGDGKVLFGNAVGERIQYNNDKIILSASDFFLGSSATQYISGSGGNLEISSSNFFLSASVVRTSASVWSQDGNLGGWKVSATAITSPDGDIVLNSQNTYISLGDTPPTSYSSGEGSFIDGNNNVLFGKAVGERIQYSSGKLILSSSTFFLGSTATQYISGSGGNLVISSSAFRLSGSELIMSGSINAITGDIGGWVIGSDKLSSPGSHVTMSSTGYISMGNPPPTSVTSGNGIFLNSDGAFLLGSSTGSRVQKTSTGALILSSSTFLLGKSGSGGTYIKGENDDLEISSSNFFIDNAGNVTMQGNVTATTGRIGGWYIGSTFLSSSNLYLDSGGNIRTGDYLSGLKGWRIRADGKAEFQDAIVRGTLATTVFEKDVIAAVGGQLIVANATVLSGSHTPATTTFYVDNAWGFMKDEICVLKTTGSLGFNTEYIKITGVYSGSNKHSMSVDRGFDESTAVGYSSSQVIVSQGMSGSGFVYINSAPSKSLYSEYAPYIDVIVRTGSNQFNEVQVKARLGNLNGLYPSKIATQNPGYGLFTENGYFTGMVSASEGNIGGWTINSASLDAPSRKVKIDSTHAYIAMGNPPPTSSLSGTGAYIDGYGNILLGKAGGGRLTYRPDTGKLIISSSEFYLGGSSVYISGSLNHLRISSSNFHVAENGDVTMTGTITATDGAIGGWNINSESLDAPSGRVKIDSSHGYIAMGNPPPTSSLAGTGVYLDGYGNTLIGKSTGGRITYRPNTGKLILSSSEFFLGGTGTQYISSVGDNLIISASGFYLATSVSGSYIKMDSPGALSPYLLLGDETLGLFIYGPDYGPGFFFMKDSVEIATIYPAADATTHMTGDWTIDGVLNVGSALVMNGNGTGSIVGGTLQTAATGQRIIISSGGPYSNQIQFYDSSNNLVRLYANVSTLYTPNSFTTLGDLSTAQQLYVGTGYGFNVDLNGVITWNSDTNFYRSNADYLKTDDSLTVVGNAGISGSLRVATNAEVTGNLKIGSYISSSNTVVVTLATGPQLVLNGATSAILDVKGGSGNPASARFWNGGDYWQFGHSSDEGEYIFNWNTTTKMALSSSAQLVIGKSTFKKDPGLRLDMSGSAIVSGTLYLSQSLSSPVFRIHGTSHVSGTMYLSQSLSSNAFRIDSGKLSIGGQTSANFEIDSVGVVGGRVKIDQYSNISLAGGSGSVWIGKYNGTVGPKLDINGDLSVTGSILDDDIVYPKLTVAFNGTVTTLTIKVRRMNDTETANNYHLVTWWLSTSDMGAPTTLTSAAALTLAITAGTQIGGTTLPINVGSAGSSPTNAGIQHTLTTNNETITLTLTQTAPDTDESVGYLMAEVQGAVYSSEFTYDPGV